MSSLSRFFVTILAATMAMSAAATDYFVSTQNGDDRFDGRSASVSSSSGPFASFKPLQSLNLRHGDRILLRCGERFTGPLHLTLNSFEPGELSIGSFGECSDANRPIIDGRVPIDTAASGQIQQFKEANRIEQVFAGDNALPRARYPANGYFIVPEGAAVSAISIAPYTALMDRSMNGARLHARTQEWFIEERNVGDNGLLDSALKYPLRPKAGAYLTGKAWMLGEQRAWSFDSAEQRLSLRAAPKERLSKVPAGNLLQVTGRGSLSVAGIDFDAAGGDAIHCRLDGTVTIKQVGIHRAIGNGVAIAGANAAYIVSSVIKDVGLDAIFFAETKRVLVRRNKVVNAGIYAGPRSSLAAINAHRTSSSTIEENVVENSAYHGIRVGGDSRVRYNYVYQSCQYLSDCGAIYTWRRNADDRRPQSEIIGNIVIGAGGDTAVKFGVNDWFVGIYLDDFSNNILVAENMVVAANQGIYLHNAFSNVVKNNTVRVKHKGIADLAEVDKTPSGRYEKNDFSQNSERLGDFSAMVFDSFGKKNFEFDKPVRIELRLADLVTKERTVGKCISEPVYGQGEGLKKPVRFNLFACN